MAQSEASPVSILRRGPPRIGTAGEPPVMRMTGDYDVATVGALSAIFSSAIAFGDGDLVVDLSEVSFMDAATIGVIVRADAFLAGHARAMRLRDPSRCARRILGICGLDALIQPGADDHGSRTPATALESWAALPSEARPNRLLFGATPVACRSHGAAATRERQ